MDVEVQRGGRAAMKRPWWGRGGRGGGGAKAAAWGGGAHREVVPGEAAMFGDDGGAGFNFGSQTVLWRRMAPSGLRKVWPIRVEHIYIVYLYMWFPIRTASKKGFYMWLALTTVCRFLHAVVITDRQ